MEYFLIDSILIRYFVLIAVVDLTLPGIESFLRDVLAKENLSEEGENLRCRYLNILQDNSTGGLQDDSIDDINESNPLKIPQVKETIPPFNEGREIDDYQDETNTDHADNDEDKVFIILYTSYHNNSFTLKKKLKINV